MLLDSKSRKFPTRFGRIKVILRANMMLRRSKARRRALQLGIQKSNRLPKKDGKGVFQLLEQTVPKSYLDRLFIFSKKSFKFYTKYTCKLYLAPYSVSEDGKLEILAGRKIWIHYLVLSVLFVSMMHKFVIFVGRVAAGQLDTMTFICSASSLVYLGGFSVASSSWILRDETIDIVHGWPDILTCCSPEEGEPIPLIANTKTAVMISSLAVLNVIISLAVSGFGFGMQSLPVTYFAAAEAVGLISPSTNVPRILWKLLFWPLECLTYVLPMFVSGWAAMLMMLMVMVIMNCANQLRYNITNVIVISASKPFVLLRI